jgi:hypothetical protein
MDSPSRPLNLVHLKHQANELHRAFLRGDSVARERVQAHHPRDVAPAQGVNGSRKFQHADALLVIAREQGYDSWPKLKAGISHASDLPASACVLDIETEEVDFFFPEEAEVAIVGTITYELKEGHYRAGPYRCFRTEDLPALQQMLDAFPGLIIGHNILGFDYRALRTRLNLEPFIQKTVDTLLLLFESLGGNIESPEGDKRILRGLDLDTLGKLNIGEGKTLKGKSIGQLWRQGREEEVVAYNNADCRITHRLWEHLVTEETVTVGSGRSSRRHPLTEGDLRILRGLEPRFTFATWMEKLGRDRFIMVPPTAPKKQVMTHEMMFVDGKSAGLEFDLFLLDMVPLVRLSKSLKRELAQDPVRREGFRLDRFADAAYDNAEFSPPHDLRPILRSDDGHEWHDDFVIWLVDVQDLERQAGGNLPEQVQNDAAVRREYRHLLQRFRALWRCFEDFGED